MSPTQWSRLWHLNLLSALGRDVSLLEGIQQANDGFRREVFVVVIIDLQHGSIDTGTEALDLKEREELVGRCLAIMEVEVFGYGSPNGVGANSTKLARGLS